jgi:hypothetical protein
MCLSLVVHAGMVYTVANSARQTTIARVVAPRSPAPTSAELESLLQKATDDPRLISPAMPVPPKNLVKPAPPPPPPDEEFGESTGKGTATHNSPGDKPMEARKGSQDQPLLRQNPGAGRTQPAPPTPAAPHAPAAPSPAKAAPTPAKTAPTPNKAAPTPTPPQPAVAKKEEPPKKNVDDGPARTFGVANGDPLVPPRPQAAPKPTQLPAPAAQPQVPIAIAEKPAAAPSATALPAPAVAVDPPKSSPKRTDAPIANTAVALAEKPPADTKVADEIVRPSRGDEILSPNAAPKPAPPPAAPEPALAQEPDVSSKPTPTPRPFAVSDADPAPKADTESDAFSTLGTVVFQAGRTDARFGRRVKIKRRPEIDPLNRIDIIAAGPVVQLRVDIDETGAVTQVIVYRSSGFADTIDLPCVKAVYTWWIEPAKDRNGKLKRDSILLNISIR